jgi:hypothetical protein
LEAGRRVLVPGEKKPKNSPLNSHAEGGQEVPVLNKASG